jgi:hypothetical protein
MRILLLTLGVALAGLAADHKAEVLRDSAAWRQAVIKQDEAALKKLLADDILYSHASGQTQTKSEYIAAVVKPPARYEAFTDSETNIKVYGNTAVLTGFVDVKLVGREQYRVRTLEVYVLKGGVWQMTAHQSARISK